MDDVNHTQSARKDGELEHILSLYGIVFTKFNQEGDGIWGRFNIVLALELALFASVALFSERRPVHWRLLAGCLSVGGLVTSLWSLYVLNRLWDCHERWRSCLERIQGNFPKTWVKPVFSAHRTRKSSPKTFADWIGWLKFLLSATLRWPYFTQVYILLFVIAWTLLLFVLRYWPEWLT